MPAPHFGQWVIKVAGRALTEIARVFGGQQFVVQFLIGAARYQKYSTAVAVDPAFAIGLRAKGEQIHDQMRVAL